MATKPKELLTMRPKLVKEYRTLRISLADGVWLRRIVAGMSMEHGPKCLCVACRIRRNLEDD